MAEFYFFVRFVYADTDVFDFCFRSVTLPVDFDRKMIALPRNIFYFCSLYREYEFRFSLISSIWIALIKNFIHALWVRFRFIVERYILMIFIYLLLNLFRCGGFIPFINCYHCTLSLMFIIG